MRVNGKDRNHERVTVEELRHLASIAKESHDNYRGFVVSAPESDELMDSETLLEREWKSRSNHRDKDCHRYTASAQAYPAME